MKILTYTGITLIAVSLCLSAVKKHTQAQKSDPCSAFLVRAQKKINNAHTKGDLQYQRSLAVEDIVNYLSCKDINPEVKK